MTKRGLLTKRISCGVLRPMIVLVSILPLLSFPAVKAHNFDDHFRVSEVRRFIVRNTEVQCASDSDIERIAQAVQQLDPLIRFNDESPLPSPLLILSEPDVPVVRLLLRHKPAPRRGEPDPLLQPHYS